MSPQASPPIPPAVVPGAGRQPNEVDLRRISRALEQRVRYRYVSPIVEPVEGGYRILSPCCSRNVDSSGGIIDIARLEYDEALNVWKLYRKDHGRGEWLLHDSSRLLDDLMTRLIADPFRVFWQ